MATFGRCYPNYVRITEHSVLNSFGPRNTNSTKHKFVMAMAIGRFDIFF